MYLSFSIGQLVRHISPMSGFLVDRYCAERGFANQRITGALGNDNFDATRKSDKGIRLRLVFTGFARLSTSLNHQFMEPNREIRHSWQNSLEISPPIARGPTPIMGLVVYV